MHPTIVAAAFEIASQPHLDHDHSDSELARTRHCDDGDDDTVGVDIGSSSSSSSIIVTVAVVSGPMPKLVTFIDRRQGLRSQCEGWAKNSENSKTNGKSEQRDTTRCKNNPHRQNKWHVYQASARLLSD
jgi:hypothetical protein